jgi:Arc/MetJ-type ribon-helix-helix transcriptional regulator
MKMLTVRLPEKLIAEIERESRLCKLSVSDVVRERLHKAPKSQQAQSSSALDLIADLIGSVERLPVDLSTNKKSYLRSMGYGENRSSRQRLSRRPTKPQ